MQSVAMFLLLLLLLLLQDLACQCCVTAVRPALYLYTAPPKAVLKDLDSSLYAQQLIPAVHIHVGIDPKKAQGLPVDFQGPFLLPEVMARMQDEPPAEGEAKAGGDEREGGSREQGTADVDVAAVLRAAASGQQGQQRPTAAAGGGKVPKWLKMK